MLPLGILNASTKNVRMKRKRTTAMMNDFAHSARSPRRVCGRLSTRSASAFCAALMLARRGSTGVGVRSLIGGPNRGAATGATGGAAGGTTGTRRGRRGPRDVPRSARVPGGGRAGECRYGSHAP
jgi:hypothetical protein